MIIGIFIRILLMSIYIITKSHCSYYKYYSYKNSYYHNDILLNNNINIIILTICFAINCISHSFFNESVLIVKSFIATTSLLITIEISWSLILIFLVIHCLLKKEAPKRSLLFKPDVFSILLYSSICCKWKTICYIH